MVTRLRRATGDTFASLRIRNFRLFLGGQLISQIGTWLTMVAQTIFVLELTDSGVAVGVLAAAQFGPVLLIGPFAGLVADRSDKRRLLLVVQVAAMVHSFAMAGLAFMGDPPLPAIYAVAFFGGLAVAFDNPARRSFVVEMVPETHINNAVSLNSALMTGARVVGPAVAGAMILTFGFGWAFLLDGTSYLAVIYGLWRIDPSRLRSTPVTPRGRGQVRAGLRYARSVPELWVPLVMMAVIGTLAFNFQTVLPLFATRDLAGSASTFTVLMSVLSAGSFVGALAAARRTSIDVGTVGRAAVAFGLAMGTLALAPTLPMALAVGFVVGLASIAFMTASTALVQIEADPAMRGRVLALQAMVFLGSTPIGGPVAGWVAEHHGARWSLGIGALAAVVAGVAGLLSVRRRRTTAALVGHDVPPADHGESGEPGDPGEPPPGDRAGHDVPPADAPVDPAAAADPVAGAGATTPQG